MCRQQAYDYPVSFFQPSLHRPVRQPPDDQQLQVAVGLIARAESAAHRCRRGRSLFSGLCGSRQNSPNACAFPSPKPRRARVPCLGTTPWNVGAMGVTGSAAANSLADGADLIIAVGTRLQDFTTGSGLLIGAPELQPAQHQCRPPRPCQAVGRLAAVGRAVRTGTARPIGWMTRTSRPLGPNGRSVFATEWAQCRNRCGIESIGQSAIRCQRSRCGQPGIRRKRRGRLRRRWPSR